MVVLVAINLARQIARFSILHFSFMFSQHSPTTRPFVERTAEKGFLLSGRVWLSSTEARVEGIKGGSVGVGEGISMLAEHIPNPSQPV